MCLAPAAQQAWPFPSSQVSRRERPACASPACGPAALLPPPPPLPKTFLVQYSKTIAKYSMYAFTGLVGCIAPLAAARALRRGASLKPAFWIFQLSLLSVLACIGLVSCGVLLRTPALQKAGGQPCRRQGVQRQQLMPCAYIVRCLNSLFLPPTPRNNRLLSSRSTCLRRGARWAWIGGCTCSAPW